MSCPVCGRTFTKPVGYTTHRRHGLSCRWTPEEAAAAKAETVERRRTYARERMRRIHNRVSWAEWLAKNALTPEERRGRPTEYTRRWRAKHPDYNREYMARWYAAHPGYQAAAGKKRRRKARRAKRQAEYYRRWRADHPDYHARWRGERVESERARMKAWRLANPDKVREQKRRWSKNRQRAAPTAEPMPVLHLGHDLFEAARAIVGPDRNSGLSFLRDPLHEDLMSEAVLAMLEGRDAEQAVRTLRGREYGWRRITGPLMLE